MNKNASLQLKLMFLSEYLRCNFIQRVNSFLWNKIQEGGGGECKYVLSILYDFFFVEGEAFECVV